MIRALLILLLFTSIKAEAFTPQNTFGVIAERHNLQVTEIGDHKLTLECHDLLDVEEAKELLASFIEASSSHKNWTIEIQFRSADGAFPPPCYLSFIRFSDSGISYALTDLRGGISELLHTDFLIEEGSHS